MTQIQRQALKLMAEQNIGAMPVNGFGWIFPTHIRNDYECFGEDNAIKVAEEIVSRLEEDSSLEGDRCPDCGSTEAGNCFYCQM